ncbi:MAG TPA: long-chain fatty acid--CoA ligase, partial [Candidatus Angelobacter sp.]|nr:long-chain fatty acid--CoA ligase [Candidatus Angelobacter sp.]
RENGEWTAISAAQIHRWVTAIARKLQEWGVRQGDRVVLLSENRPEWAVVDYATLLLGGVVVPIYATQTAEQVLYVLRHSEARVAFVSSRKQYEKVEAVQQASKLERIVVMDKVDDLPDVPQMQFLLSGAKDLADSAIEAFAHTVQPDDIATLIYTSGTTGTPKGVILTHGNIASNLGMSVQLTDIGLGDVAISFLPLSHITARHVDYLVACRGATLAYCPDFNDLPRTLLEVRPSVFVGVPRVYEKIHNQIQHKTQGIKRKLFDWALGVGRKYRDQVINDQVPSALTWKLANRLVFSKIREGVGGRSRLFISGGAPLGKELAAWFADVGIRIDEGYGLTETSPVIAVNTERDHKLGTVGKTLSNLEVRVAADGEVLVRGPSIFKGYWNMPEETASAFEDDWFKTGDIGHIDEDGYLSITDRKKDLIKTSGGKFIAPQPIENSLKANLYIGEAAVVGDQRRFPSVLIVPNFPMLEDWAKTHGVAAASRKDLVRTAQVQSLYEGIVDELNDNLAQYEKLKKVLVLPEELSIADGTLTPSMKLRRRHLEQRYRKQIDALYAEEQEAGKHNPIAAYSRK